MWLAYPSLGYYIGKKGRDYKLYPWVLMMVICLIACFYESKWLYSYHENGLGATKVSAMFFSVSTIFVLFNKRTQNALMTGKANRFWCNIFIFLGEMSFGIYLIHKYFLDYFISILFQDTIVRSLLTLLLSVAFISLIKIIVPSSMYRYLGLK